MYFLKKKCMSFICINLKMHHFSSQGETTSSWLCMTGCLSGGLLCNHLCTEIVLPRTVGMSSVEQTESQSKVAAFRVSGFHWSTCKDVFTDICNDLPAK